MANPSYDVIVIGSGPGGYVAAIRAAQLGLKTAIVEKDNSLGGTCLNVGCIPSKALLDSSELYYKATHEFREHGIQTDSVKVDLPKMIARKDEVVKQTVAGVKFLMKKNKIDVYHGYGSFENDNTIHIALNSGGEQRIEGKHIIIATGSVPASLPGVVLDGKRIITSTEALELQAVPETMVVIGGGVIGLEMGSVYARLGTKIRVVEYADTIIPSMDRELGKEMQKILKKLGFEFFFQRKVQKAESNGKSVTVTAENADGKIETFEAEYCLVAVGRKAYTDKLGLEKVGIKTDNRGRIEVNEKLQVTGKKHIYAIGDVIKGAMLAHKASDEGVMVAELIAGRHAHVNYLCIPGVVYTWPEVASVGYTEEELKTQQREYKVGKFPFMASGRARAANDTDGFIKVLADKKTDEILGIHMIGARCADIIAEAVVAMEFRASAEDLAIFSHAHPTFTESLKEAALAATENRALHI